jgi:hypothetical protein
MSDFLISLEAASPEYDMEIASVLVRKVSKDKLERWRSLSEAKKKKRIII